MCVFSPVRGDFYIEQQKPGMLEETHIHKLQAAHFATAKHPNRTGNHFVPEATEVSETPSLINCFPVLWCSVPGSVSSFSTALAIIIIIIIRQQQQREHFHRTWAVRVLEKVASRDMAVSNQMMGSKNLRRLLSNHKNPWIGGLEVWDIPQWDTAEGPSTSAQS